jgi:hypothetical protein
MRHVRARGHPVPVLGVSSLTPEERDAAARVTV